MNCVEVDTNSSPAGIHFPDTYNLVNDLLYRHIAEGKGEKVALIDDTGEHTYTELSDRAGSIAGSLIEAGMQGERIMLVLEDSVDFVATFLGAIQAGIIPVPLNTSLTTDDYQYIIRDSGVSAAVVSQTTLDSVTPSLTDGDNIQVLVADRGDDHDYPSLYGEVATNAKMTDVVESESERVAFWLYTSGSTGLPKGVLHTHRNLIVTSVLAGNSFFGLTSDDVVYSTSKLFFAYGLGNSLSLPLYAGATAVVRGGRPLPGDIFNCLETYRPTLFFSVPTVYNALLGDHEGLKCRALREVKFCVSAGEPLPQAIGVNWRKQYGVDIVDGLGSTELLYIFLSNSPDEVRYGVTGFPVPGYEVKLMDQEEKPVNPGEVGQLWVRGPSRTVGYWNLAETNRETFIDEWMKTGDQFKQNEQECFEYQGRSDDMLKVGGIYVSPFEIEGVLLEHDKVAEAAIVGHHDGDGLIKPRAFIVLHSGVEESHDLADSLKTFVKERLAPYKYPRWIEFVRELPKTSTGKIQRFKLRV